MADYYFSSSTGSDDTGDGSIGNPYKTYGGGIGSWTSALNPGDRLLFKRGDTWRGGDCWVRLYDNGGNADNYVEIDAYGTGDNPILSSSEVRTDWYHYSGEVWYCGMYISNHPGMVIQDDNVLRCMEGNYNFTDSPEDLNRGYIYYSSSQDRVYVRCTDGGDPRTKTMEVPTSHRHDAYLGVIGIRHDSPYVKVSNITVRGTDYHCFSTTAQHTYFYNCLAQYAGGAGFYWFRNISNAVAGYGEAHNCIAEYTNHQTSQAFTMEGNDIWLYDCTARYNDMAGFDWLDYSSLTEVKDCGAVRCISHHNGLRPGCWDSNFYVDGAVGPITMIDCVAWSPNKGGPNWNPGFNITIGSEDSNKHVHDITLQNCLAFDSDNYECRVQHAYSSTTAAMGRIHFRNCTFVNTNGNPALLLDDHDSSGVTIHNCILYTNGSEAPLDITSGKQGYVDSDYNLFYSTGGYAVEVGSTNYNLNSWIVLEGEDTNSVLGNPIFVDGSDGTDYDGYYVADYSPAVDAGNYYSYLDKYSVLGSTQTTGVQDVTSAWDMGYHYDATWGTGSGDGDTRTSLACSATVLVESEADIVCTITVLNKSYDVVDCFIYADIPGYPADLPCSIDAYSGDWRTQLPCTITVSLVPSLTNLSCSIEPVFDNETILYCSINANIPDSEYTFQQGIRSYTGCEDTYILEDSASSNYSGEIELRVENLPTTYPHDKVSLLSFDVSTVQNSVTSARLHLYASTAGNKYQQIYLRRSRREFVASEATWNKASNAESWTTGGAWDSTNDYEHLDSLPYIVEDYDENEEFVFDHENIATAVENARTGSGRVYFILHQRASDSKDFFMKSSEHPDTNYRPKLSVFTRLGTASTLRCKITPDTLQNGKNLQCSITPSQPGTAMLLCRIRPYNTTVAYLKNKINVIEGSWSNLYCNVFPYVDGGSPLLTRVRVALGPQDFTQYDRGFPFTEETITNVRITTFENGTEQRQNKWGGKTKKKFTLSFNVNTKTEIEAIRDFFVTEAGPSTVFQFTNPIDGTTYNVRFVENSFTAEKQAPDLFNAKVTLIAVW